MVIHMLVATLVVTLLLEIVGLKECIIGWVWGCFANIVYMVVLGVLVFRAAQRSTNAAVSASKVGMFIRFGIIALLTLLADVLFIEFHYIAYIGGLFIWQPFSFYEHIRSCMNEEKHIFQ